ncbi:acyl-homoserine-lactone synthase [Paludibacterium paludis]|uniref:Acyl-homoserine-lactone synthase n=1 Tax=Paludibacterium paludis TaxID=1225769 RepID=A0A918P6T4_9NEIS|nr:acyl-homoserine-lactone synthase [Paludibacterium paludis]GGY27716.1 hypothetical protein GCM10011289_33830 [Paludibacterium paludis]
MAFLSLSSQEGLRLETIRGGRRQTELLRFRHEIFREKLKWVELSADGLDKDEYDAFSHNLAVIDGNEVVGSVRYTEGHYPFMIEKEFARLLPGGFALRKGRHAGEVTRFAVASRCLNGGMGSASRLLYLSLYEWSRLHDVKWLYFVVEPPFFRHLTRLGFPTVAIGEAKKLDGGVLSQAGYMDWPSASPDFIHWLREAAVFPAATQERSRAYDYSH